MKNHLSFKIISQEIPKIFRRTKCDGGKKNEKVAPLSEIHRFVVDCLSCLNVAKEKSTVFADSLVASDYKGVYSHGLNRLEAYIKDIREKACDANADPTILTECASIAAVCGNNGLGAVIGTFCMDIAIKKARETGIGMVVTNGSNHFGTNMFYTEKAVRQGLIGMAFTNTSPVMVPAGAKQVCLGTNPISIAAPAECGDSLVVDMATTAVSVGKIEMHRRKKQKIPPTWALDEHGKPTTDPEVAMKNRRLMPLGGDVSYKGTAFALMTECLSSIIADAAYGPNVRLWGIKSTEPANLGHGFIAIDPDKFLPGFKKRLSDLLNFIRHMEPADPKHPLLIPGDAERANMKRTDQLGGIIYTPSHLKMLEKLTKQFNVKPIQFK
ncbi:(2R)-3-sulfolactate dehydrogenase (NADP(+))-like [Diorhabda carinulata]|uniref:(2R)-3-sulfolactate dehydrogenase (NADP(+))-like n=1 Tax=Diorhabda carinulata TaxID=1163345 RepID=UPI0025A00F5F|nr:(2R)-3-sulfolactate dehydrogenase (NADP(+))-like [Diorhabda carinulata]